MKQPICIRTRIGTSFPNSMGTGTVYLFPYHNTSKDANDGSWNGTESNRTVKWKRAGTISHLYVKVPTAPGTGKSRTFTIRQNGADAAVTVTISGTSTTGNDTTNTVTVTIDDLICIKEVGSGGPADSDAYISYVFDSDSLYHSVYPFLISADGGGGGLQITPFSCAIGSSVMPMAGSADALTVYLSSAPGTGKSFTYVWSKNGVNQDGTGGTPNTSITISNAATSGAAAAGLSWSAGDIIDFTIGSTGSPTIVNHRGCVVVQASTAGNSMVLAAKIFLSTSANNFFTAIANGASTTAGTVETDCDMLWPSSDVQLKALWVRDGIDGTFTFRNNGANGNLTKHQLSDGVSHSDTSHTDSPSAGNPWALKSVPDGTGSSIAFKWGLSAIDSSALVPIVTTLAATSLRSTSATLNGTINPEGSSITGKFRWGTDPTLTTYSTVGSASIGSGTSDVPYDYSLTGLTPSTTYYFQAEGYDGTSNFLGSILSFDTLAAPVLESSDVGLAWVEFTDQLGNLHVWSKTPLPDPGTYYGGYKEERMDRYGALRFQLSDRTGRFVGQIADWDTHDKDFAIRTLLASSSTKAFRNRPYTIRSISDTERRALNVPFTVAKGLVQKFTPGNGMMFHFEGQDPLLTRFNVSGKDHLIPDRPLMSDDFSNIDAPLTHSDTSIEAVKVALTPGQVIYGDINGTYGGLPPSAYVGTYSGYYWWVFACHACQSIDQIYVGGTAINMVTDTASGSWIIPGWNGEAKYTDINSRRWCIVKGRVGDTDPDRAAGVVDLPVNAPGLKLTADIKGIENQGDGSGVLLTNMSDVYLHILVNWILQTYQSGAWLGIPNWPDDASLPMIDVTYFDSAQTHSVERFSGNGYQFAGVIGWRSTYISPNDLITQLNVSADVNSGWSRKCQYIISMERESSGELSSTTRLNHFLDGIKGAWSMEFRDNEHFNKYKYKAKKDYTEKYHIWAYISGEGTRPDIIDSTSITNYGGDPIGVFTAPDTELWWVRDSDQSIDVMNHNIRRTADPPAYATMRMPWRFVTTDIGDVVRVTTPDGIGAISVPGFVDRPMRVYGRTPDPNLGQVEFLLYDLGNLY